LHLLPLNITSKAALSHGSGVWILNKMCTKRLEAEKMRFLTPLLGLTRGEKKKERNTSIREQLQVLYIANDVTEGKLKWRKYVAKREEYRLPLFSFHYHPSGCRDVRRQKQG